MAFSRNSAYGNYPMCDRQIRSSLLIQFRRFRRFFKFNMQAAADASNLLRSEAELVLEEVCKGSISDEDELITLRS